MTDRCHRAVTYFRVSVTDRCNLRCFYCMPRAGISLFDHQDLLSYEEILRVVRIATEMGVTKVRITGGEPLIRRNLVALVRELAALPAIKDLGLTTNGVLLKDMARSLWDAGLRRVNVSLDTLDPSKFRSINGTDRHAQVLAGIAEAEAVGFLPIKINVVVVRGVNDDEIGRFARLASERPYAVRFIEFMPTGQVSRWDPSQVLSAEEIREHLRRYGPLVAIPQGPNDGPAKRFRLGSSGGEVGIIGAVSEHFCGQCNRLRLTSDGKLKPCLLSEVEVDVRGALRRGCPDDDLRALLKRSVLVKPRGHGLAPADRPGPLGAMSRIGG